MLVCGILRSAGYATLAAYEGSSALKLIRQGPLSAVILDFMFPNGGGVAVHKGLRAQPETKDTPVIMLSALSAETISQDVDMDEHTYYMGKPFNRTMLLGLVSQVLS